MSKAGRAARLGNPSAQVENCTGQVPRSPLIGMWPWGVMGQIPTFRKSRCRELGESSTRYGDGTLREEMV
jgi:hypothetical protein